jgi:3-oxoadipate enol-lactonase
MVREQGNPLFYVDSHFFTSSHRDAEQPVIVLLHGFPLTHRMWDQQTSCFAATHRVIAVDLQGFGASQLTASSNPSTLTMADLGRDVIALCDLLQLTRRVTVCGLSMGGYVAFWLLKHFPDRFERAILCNTKAANDTPEGVANRLRIAEKVLEVGSRFQAEVMLPKLFATTTRTAQPELITGVEEAILQTPAATIAAAQRGMAERDDARRWLSEITQPVLVVAGTEDVISPAAEMREFAEQIPKAEFVAIERAGHLSPMEQPAQFNEIVLQFLAKG